MYFQRAGAGGALFAFTDPSQLEPGLHEPGSPFPSQEHAHCLLPDI